jgi:hypothetical protein
MPAIAREKFREPNAAPKIHSLLTRQAATRATAAGAAKATAEKCRFHAGF